jgi:hypothetical protein
VSKRAHLWQVSKPAAVQPEFRYATAGLSGSTARPNVPSAWQMVGASRWLQVVTCYSRIESGLSQSHGMHKPQQRAGQLQQLYWDIDNRTLTAHDTAPGMGGGVAQLYSDACCQDAWNEIGISAKIL